MNSNQRSQENNQSATRGNEKTVPSTRGASHQSTDRAGSQTGNEQRTTPRGARHLAADDDLDDDTGLSNRANRQSADIAQGDRQAAQSNVGRRDDGTPD